MVVLIVVIQLARVVESPNFVANTFMKLLMTLVVVIIIVLVLVKERSL